jgi:hypothetical protein
LRLRHPLWSAKLDLNQLGRAGHPFDSISSGFASERDRLCQGRQLLTLYFAK